MKASEIRELGLSELKQKVVELKEELFNLRFQLAIGQVKDPSRITLLKRDIARMKTVLNERKLASVS